MTRINTQPETDPGLTEQEIQETFDRLNLVDPILRDYLKLIDSIPPARSDEPAYWIQGHSTTNFSAPTHA